jgi:hypothetical protein
LASRRKGTDSSNGTQQNSNLHFDNNITIYCEFFRYIMRNSYYDERMNVVQQNKLQQQQPGSWYLIIHRRDISKTKQASGVTTMTTKA